MSRIKHIVLDVLKPHHPTVVQLAQAITDRCPEYRVQIEVAAVDEKTETILLEIDADHIDYDAVADVITSLGGSVHSIDRVEIHGDAVRRPGKTHDGR